MKISDNDQTGDYKTKVEIDMDSYDPVINITIEAGTDFIPMNYADFCNIRDFIEGFERKIARIKAVK